ncbi:MAG TPA: hypothetical protein DCY07_02860 [Rhodospirillaceae bacterium]|nr:hypothetical protein [Rhodospirillaceae bacterium]
MNWIKSFPGRYNAIIAGKSRVRNEINAWYLVINNAARIIFSVLVAMPFISCKKFQNQRFMEIFVR